MKDVSLSNQTFQSAHNQIEIKIQIENGKRFIQSQAKSAQKKVFELSWNWLEPTCGKSLAIQSHGLINSPGYPNPYPANSSCDWLIKVPLDKRVQLNWANLDLPALDSKCVDNSLIVYDGQLDSDPVLGTFCGSSVPLPVTSSGSNMLVRMKTGGSKATGSGFLATYSAQSARPGCGMLYTEDRGRISWAPLPDNEDDLSCEWRIRLRDPTSRIKLNFDWWNLDDTNACHSGAIELFDGPDETFPLLATFCTAQFPSDLLSTTSQVYLRMRLKNTQKVAFAMHYDSICWQRLESETGQLVSPGFPQSFASNVKCIYEIVRPTGWLLQLQFDTFQLSKESDCDSPATSTLNVFEMNSKNTPIGSYCGMQSPAPIVSTWNAVRIEFEAGPGPISANSSEPRSFAISYTSLPIGCGGILKKSPGELRSPKSVTGGYRPRSNCSWLLTAPTDHVIRLSFNSFALETHSQCRFDFVRVLDSSLNEIGRFCGKQLPPTLQSLDNEMIVQFASDDSVHMNGFSATYVFVEQKSTCGGNVAADSGQISSPDFQSSRPYAPNLHCTWHLVASQGRQIRLQFEFFDVESGDCNHDRLEIFNGPEINSPLLGKFCGQDIPPILVSHSSRLLIRFISDASRSGRGFR
jgi:cubilin